MIWVAVEEQLDENVRKHAGGKAREDLSSIFAECGYTELSITMPLGERQKASSIQKLFYHFETAKIWRRLFRIIEPGDTLILQFPIVNHTLLFNNVLKQLKNRGVEIFAFIHDLEILRMSNDARNSWVSRWRMKKEEVDELYLFDRIVVHNEKMKKLLADKYNIDERKMKVLNIFDYLTSDEFLPSAKYDNYQSCIIAGNLNRNKSGYIYDLPNKPDYELYGVNFEGIDNPNAHYHGSFLADELPFHMRGGFGLVWDGDSTSTCSGAWGEYLRYNNPHKTSLYLACGIPVIIWKEAALADYIQENKAGFTVSSLDEIDNAIQSIDGEEYREMKENAIEISQKMRNGYYTKSILKEMGIYGDAQTY